MQLTLSISVSCNEAVRNSFGVKWKIWSNPEFCGQWGLLRRFASFLKKTWNTKQKELNARQRSLKEQWQIFYHWYLERKNWTFLLSLKRWKSFLSSKEFWKVLKSDCSTKSILEIPPTPTARLDREDGKIAFRVLDCAAVVTGSRSQNSTEELKSLSQHRREGREGRVENDSSLKVSVRR